MTWKGGTESTLRGYKFTYDGLDRLSNAVYGEGTTIAGTNRFGETPTYDKHGNITQFVRMNNGTSATLSMGYNGNQLTRKGTSAYAYDANGNMTADNSKNISNIQYNILNLPKQVTLSSGGVIGYVYDATGIKRQVTHQGEGVNKTTDYCGNVIYENGTLSKILTEEGYITLSGTTPTYHYYLKDHLGNNRVVLNQDGTTVEQVNHYYPFGGVFDQTAEATQPYKFGGKEFDRTYGLDLYDYSARYMDATLGRFTTMDPLAEKYYGVSPYAYCAGNPVKYVDPTGMVIGEPLIPRFQRRPYTGNILSKAGSFFYNTGAAITNAPIDIVNSLVDETIFIAENGVGSYLGAAGNTISSAIEGEINYRTGTSISQQTSDFISDIKNPEIWENVAAGTVLMAIPGTIGTKTTNTSQRSKVIQAVDDSFAVTPQGITLSKSLKIPAEYIDNPNRPGSYGIMENGKFVEKLRIDPATKGGSKGPNYSHFHKDNKGKHDTNLNNWPK